MDSVKSKPKFKKRTKSRLDYNPNNRIEEELNIGIYNDIDLIFKQIKDAIKV